jgi:hypothetical protein
MHNEYFSLMFVGEEVKCAWQGVVMVNKWIAAPHFLAEVI